MIHKIMLAGVAALAMSGRALAQLPGTGTGNSGQPILGTSPADESATLNGQQGGNRIAQPEMTKPAPAGVQPEQKQDTGSASGKK